ncbi:hypothetical protein [uncultured Anaerotruncus sp.]|nr:hypothetical protein [uncultured Anaerotruncus sp.]
MVCNSKPDTFGFSSHAAYLLDYERKIREIFAWVNGGDGPALVNP